MSGSCAGSDHLPLELGHGPSGSWPSGGRIVAVELPLSHRQQTGSLLAKLIVDGQGLERITAESDTVANQYGIAAAGGVDGIGQAGAVAVAS